MASCGGSLVKIILFVFNVLWLVLGGVIIWLGVTITNWSGDVGAVLDNNMKGGSIAVIVAGALIFLVAFLGCCGACKENSCMLSTYGGIILILVIMQCVGVYFAFHYKTQIDDEIEKGMQKQLDRFLDDKEKPSEEAAKIVHSIEKTFKCCGVTGPENYDHYQYGRPASCCGQSFGDDPLKAKCTEPQNLYKTGCATEVKDTMKKYLGSTAGVAIALVLIQLLIVVMACCLSREVRN